MKKKIFSLVCVLLMALIPMLVLSGGDCDGGTEDPTTFTVVYIVAESHVDAPESRTVGAGQAFILPSIPNPPFTLYWAIQGNNDFEQLRHGEVMPFDAHNTAPGGTLTLVANFVHHQNPLEVARANFIKELDESIDELAALNTHATLASAIAAIELSIANWQGLALGDLFNRAGLNAQISRRNEFFRSEFVAHWNAQIAALDDVSYTYANLSAIVAIEDAIASYAGTLPLANANPALNLARLNHLRGRFNIVLAQIEIDQLVYDANEILTGLSGQNVFFEFSLAVNEAAAMLDRMIELETEFGAEITRCQTFMDSELSHYQSVAAGQALIYTEVNAAIEFYYSLLDFAPNFDRVQYIDPDDDFIHIYVLPSAQSIGRTQIWGETVGAVHVRFFRYEDDAIAWQGLNEVTRQREGSMVVQGTSEFSRWFFMTFARYGAPGRVAYDNGEPMAEFAMQLSGIRMELNRHMDRPDFNYRSREQIITNNSVRNDSTILLLQIGST